MSSPLLALLGAAPKAPAAQPVPPASRADARPSEPPQGGRWWYVFDRWLAVTDIASEQEEFVLA